MKKIITAILLFCFFSGSFASAETNLNINAKSAVLAEAETGEVLYSLNETERLPIASVTKIMTMLLICEALDSGKISLDDMVPVSEYAMSMGGSTMFLEAGEKLCVSDMLKGIAVASANDGCVAMAEYLEGTCDRFVEKMNEKAISLGMKNTHFVNTNGLDADEHYSSAEDVAVMSRELMKHDVIFNYTRIWTDSLRDGKFQLANTNKLVRFYDGATGLKTGSTSKALCCISATAKREDMHLIAVVLGAPNSKERFGSAREMLDYGFSAYKVKKYVSKGENTEEIKIVKGVKDSVVGYVSENISALEPKGEERKTEKQIEIFANLKAPIQKDEPIGEVIITSEGKEIGRSDILASESIDKKSFSATFLECFCMLLS